MTDRQPSPGKEGLMKHTPCDASGVPTGAPAYYAKADMADSPLAIGTPFSKANLLSDTTAAKLNGVETPNAAFDLLSRFHTGMGNEYVWNKTKKEVRYKAVMESTEIYLYSTDYTQYSYYRSVTVNELTGQIQATNQFVPTSPPGTANYAYWDNLIVTGCYILYQSNYHQIVARGQTESAWIKFDVQKITSQQYMKDVSYGYVNSPNTNSYPPSPPDEYAYIPLGKIGSQLRIETVTYVGTGTYGGNNPTQVTFSRTPQVVFIIGFSDSSYTTQSFTITFVRGAELVCYLSNRSGSVISNELVTLWGNNWLSWYVRSNNSPHSQANVAGKKYLAVAITEDS